MKWQIGDVTVTKIVEMETTGGSHFILPQANREAIQGIPWLSPDFADENGRLKMSIIVDTCLGNDKKGRNIPTWNDRQGRFLDDLMDAGFSRNSIDTVLCTHLHVDHVGWNTMLENGIWKPTFPNARYLFGRVEYGHWIDQSERPDMEVVLSDSVQPIFDRGLAELVEWDHQICSEVQLTPTIGHTPGHTSVLINSNGQRALISGDFAHHPCQMARPEWSSSADHDQSEAEATRRRVLGELSGEPILLIGTHFSGPTAGLVERDGDAFRLAVSS